MPKDILKNEKLIIGFDPKLLTKQNLNLIFGKKSLCLQAFKQKFNR